MSIRESDFTASEITAMSAQHTCKDIVYVNDFFKEILRLYSERYSEDKAFAGLCSLCALYYAGYLSGRGSKGRSKQTGSHK